MGAQEVFRARITVPCACAEVRETSQIILAFSFFYRTWNHKRIVDVCETLQRIYRDLQDQTPEITIRVNIIVFTVITTYLFMIGFANIITNNADNDVVFLLVYANSLWLYCTEVAFLLHFTHVAQVITTGFKIVNVRITEEIAYDVTQQTLMGRRLPDTAIFHTTRSVLSKIKKLKTLMNTYWMLCDAVHQANDFYCDQLMAIMFSLFVHVTTRSYFFFLHVQTGKVLNMTNEGAWSLAYICYAVLLVTSSTDVTNSADNTRTTICKFINEDLDPDIKKEMEEFLLQLPHHNARFSARGFFQIHNETLTSMAGAVTTYLAVLIQFQTEPPTT
ncbi:gustatory receptor for sugar taste 43a-like [Homalodisca vitripennis]|uniref:gustatory receptor for sugar taste 43a-like n=1 Tax=Homalodisca vitripennis TaxID=197043 RepID=UPI001EEB2AB2|nr:gustatory receptor for sugar taste 43a-like [Homalodisca vitripennis]